MQYLLLFVLLIPGCGIFKAIKAPTPVTQEPAEEPVSAEDIAKKVVALVNLEGRFCSGVLAEGVVLTAKHCVEDGEPFAIETYDGKLYDALVAAKDPEYDLAVLATVGLPMKDTIKLVDYSPQLGQRVIWMGFPLGGEFHLAVGVVSNTFIEEGNSFTFQGQVIPGQSGGPVFDEFGNLLGIVSSFLAIQEDKTHPLQMLPVGLATQPNHIQSLIDSL